MVATIAVVATTTMRQIPLSPVHHAKVVKDAKAVRDILDNKETIIPLDLYCFYAKNAHILSDFYYFFQTNRNYS